MTTLRDLVHEVQLTLNGYGLSQPRAAFLATPIGPTDLFIKVGNATNFSQGVAEIGDEVVFIESVDVAANTLALSPDGRGYYGTTPAAHAANSRIESAATWPRHRIRGAVNDVIVGLYPTLWGIGSVTFPASNLANTYELPAEAEQILSVTAGGVGPSRELETLRRWSFNSLAPSSEFPSGNAITLQQFPAPGRPVTVNYLQELKPLESLDDDLTSSGLRESAKFAVVLGTCAQLLAFMDAARLPVDTARADEYDERNAVGIAARVAANLTARFDLEVERERRRLRTITPVSINVRGR